MSFNPFPAWITLIWPVILALIGLCVSPALNWLAETVHRGTWNLLLFPPRGMAGDCHRVALWPGWLAIRLDLAGCGQLLVRRRAVLVTATDLEHRLIPNRFILPAILFALAVGFIATWMTWKVALLGGAVGLVFLPWHMAWRRWCTRKIGLGMAM